VFHIESVAQRGQRYDRFPMNSLGVTTDCRNGRIRRPARSPAAPTIKNPLPSATVSARGSIRLNQGANRAI
jgi:hypothetical protein